MIQLVAKPVPKLWGVRELPPMFARLGDSGEPVGEIWFEHPDGADSELLVKYLFTTEKLSIQVHPDDALAARSGGRRGKDEAWLVLGAEPDASIGIGVREPVSSGQLREAALDGSIERRLAWHPVAAGDFFFSPAGTVHAIGGGLALIEIQQNCDLNYRLYDYGRPRELHLDEGIEAANPAPYEPPMRPYLRDDGREILAEGQTFVVERWTKPFSGRLSAMPDNPVWLIPVTEGAELAGKRLPPGTVWLADGPAPLALAPGAELLVAYAGAAVAEGLAD